MLGALALTVAVSLSAEAQIVAAPPALLNTNGDTDIGNDINPQVATDGAGNWVAVWTAPEDFGGTVGTDFDIFVARSTDNGATWTAPALLNTNGSTDLGTDSRPQVTTDGAGNWVAVWESSENLTRRGTAGTDNDIFVARSTDNGATWTVPNLLNTNGVTDSGTDRRPQLTTDGAGNWVAVWESTENLGGASTDSDIFVATSTDNGATWTTPVLLNTNAVTDSGFDGDPQLATDGTGNWLAVWRSTNTLGGTDNDIVAARSTDNGATWTAPALLNTNGGTDAGSDVFPGVATDGAGNWVAVWESTEDLGGTAGIDDDVFVATSMDNGATWTAPALLNSNGDTDTGDDDAPQVMTDGGGNWVAVWESTEDLGGTAGTDLDMFVAASTNNGATWTAPALLNTNGATDSGSDFAGAATTDGAGNWVAVWTSLEDLGGTAGTDFDNFVAAFIIVAAGGSGGSSGLCFIATAAYGTPLAEDINVLRGFRDRHLLTNVFGAAFTDAYYRLSPPIADRVASSAALAGLVRVLLTMALGWAGPLALALVLALASARMVLKRRRAHERAGRMK